MRSFSMSSFATVLVSGLASKSVKLWRCANTNGWEFATFRVHLASWNALFSNLHLKVGRQFAGWTRNVRTWESSPFVSWLSFGKSPNSTRSSWNTSLRCHLPIQSSSSDLSLLDFSFHLRLGNLVNLSFILNENNLNFLQTILHLCHGHVL